MRFGLRLRLRLGLALRLRVRLGLGLGDQGWGWAYFSVGWGGWLEIWRVKLISTQVVVEVEVGVELCNVASYSGGF